MIKISIIGGTGYTGGELLRILASHPYALIKIVTSKRYAGESIKEVYPGLAPYYSLMYEEINLNKIAKETDLVFTAVPHGKAMEIVPYLLSKGKKVIDLSADFRLKDPLSFSKWYKCEHSAEKNLKESVYGLCEIHLEEIKKTSLIANPGCYATGAILGLAPVMQGKMIDLKTIIVDSKSGTSGAGRALNQDILFCEVNEGFKAYKVGEHRHTPEIEQELSNIAGCSVKVTFTPHLLPINRGILSTIYAALVKKISTVKLVELYKKYYINSPFVSVLNAGALPNINSVKGTNYCHIGIKVDERTGRVIVVTAIDNLVKGAAGQAVQCMNLMYGFNQATGLMFPPLNP